MADVRGASGVPPLGAFGGISASTPSTPLYIDVSTGDLYAVINETVTLVGSIPSGSQVIIAGQVFDKHFVRQDSPVDVSTQLANRAFAAHDPIPAAVIGQAQDILQMRVFRPGLQPATWS